MLFLFTEAFGLFNSKVIEEGYVLSLIHIWIKLWFVIRSGMKGTMADYQIGMVSETPLMDVYPYSAGPKDKPEFDPSKA